VVPPSNAAPLADALAGLMDGRYDWQAMREAAYEMQRSRFSDSSMAAGVAKVYEEVLL
jgi:glycosyltransferase involved in cell wall biosynthesis